MAIGFNVAEATKAWCMRWKRGVLRRELLRAELRFVVEDVDFFFGSGFGFGFGLGLEEELPAEA
jgi:hypothetical protein